MLSARRPGTLLAAVFLLASGGLVGMALEVEAGPVTGVCSDTACAYVLDDPGVLVCVQSPYCQEPFLLVTPYGGCVQQTCGSYLHIIGTITGSIQDPLLCVSGLFCNNPYALVCVGISFCSGNTVSAFAVPGANVGETIVTLVVCAQGVCGASGTDVDLDAAAQRVRVTTCVAPLVGCTTADLDAAAERVGMLSCIVGVCPWAYTDADTKEGRTSTAACLVLCPTVETDHGGGDASLSACEFYTVCATVDATTLTVCLDYPPPMTCIVAAAIANLLQDIDQDGHSNTNEVQGNSNPTDAGSDPTTNDDGDCKTNEQERNLLAANGFTSYAVEFAPGVTVDPNGSEPVSLEPTFKVIKEEGSSC